MQPQAPNGETVIGRQKALEMPDGAYCFEGSSISLVLVVWGRRAAMKPFKDVSHGKRAFGRKLLRFQADRACRDPAEQLGFLPLACRENVLGLCWFPGQQPRLEVENVIESAVMSRS